MKSLRDESELLKPAPYPSWIAYLLITAILGYFRTDLMKKGQVVFSTKDFRLPERKLEIRAHDLKECHRKKVYKERTYIKGNNLRFTVKYQRLVSVAGYLGKVQ